jgi:hypothetical protein
MARLSEYLNERDLLPRGRYAFHVKEVSFVENNQKDYESIQIKGVISVNRNGESKDENHVIFRYLHPKMLWAVASDLLHCGIDNESVDTDDKDSILAAYEELVGQTLDVNVKITHSEGYEDKNDFTVRGIADGVASGAV